MQIPQLMHEQYLEAKDMIEKAKDIKVYTHIDCDGICSGAILSTILDRQNKEHEIEFVNLDKECMKLTLEEVTRDFLSYIKVCLFSLFIKNRLKFLIYYKSQYLVFS